MISKQFLVISLRGSLYAIDVAAILEIIPLPELTHVEEAPPEYVGVLNRRGIIVPVMDLCLKLGQTPRPYQLTDGVVILENLGKKIGILVSEALQVSEVQSQEITPISNFDWTQDIEQSIPSHRFISGLIKLGDKFVMVINLTDLFQQSSLPESDSSRNPSLPTGGFTRPTFGRSAEEHLVFADRSRNLAESTETVTVTGISRYALVRIGIELFGVEIDSIREFTELGITAPVPCCPPHIIGQMNLRGDLITVVDISSALGITTLETTSRRKLVVLNGPQLSAGVVVDEVLDVVHFESQNKVRALNANPESAIDHLLGLTAYGSGVVGRLDLPAFLTNGNLVVNEKP